MRDGARQIRHRDVALIAGVALALAFVVRLVWVLRVQSPQAAVYSDMAGYVSRADELLGGPAPPDPRMGAFYPWGTHVLIALEFLVFGRTSEVGIAIMHALVGAIPVACVVFVTSRFVSSRWAIACAGLISALWHPQVTYVSFFMSEIWFTAALMTAAWLSLRHFERAGSVLTTLGAGCALAVAFVVRPQVILTCGLVVVGLLVFVRSPHGSGRLHRRAARWMLLVFPLMLAMGFSAVSLHHLSGRLGLISENDAIMRLFGETNIAKVEAHWTGPTGKPAWAWYAAGLKEHWVEANVVRFDGYVGDPEVLGRVRRERLQVTPLGERIARMKNNVELLVVRNYPNPEGGYGADRRRHAFERFYRLVLINALLPLGLIGVWAMRRQRVPAIFVIANLATVVILPLFFYTEARYRVPYDPFLIIAATVGGAAVVRQLGRWLGRVRIVRASPSSADR